MQLRRRHGNRPSAPWRPASPYLSLFVGLESDIAAAAPERKATGSTRVRTSAPFGAARQTRMHQASSWRSPRSRIPPARASRLAEIVATVDAARIRAVARASDDQRPEGTWRSRLGSNSGCSRSSCATSQTFKPVPRSRTIDAGHTASLRSIARRVPSCSIEMTAERPHQPGAACAHTAAGVAVGLPGRHESRRAGVPSWRPHGGGGDRTRAVGAGVWVRQ